MCIRDRGITYEAAAGLTFALSSVGSLIQPLFGSMADRTSRPWLMSVSYTHLNPASKGEIESWLEQQGVR